MLSHINNNEPGAQTPDKIRILYTTRLPQGETMQERLDQVLFLPRLRQIVQSQEISHRLRMALDLFLTDVDPSVDLVSAASDMVIHPARIEDRNLRSAISDGDSGTSSEETVCYVCGPPQMTDSIVKRLKGMLGEGGDKRIFFEKWW